MYLPTEIETRINQITGDVTLSLTHGTDLVGTTDVTGSRIAVAVGGAP